jgi:hypothetical protein
VRKLLKEVELLQLLDLHLGRPVVREALTVFPVWNGAAVRSRGYDLSSADLSVQERTGHAVVAELVVTNNGRRPALVLEGELLEGGQQHRVAARSMLIQPGQAHVLEVRCVEQGRWSGARTHVRTGRRAPLSVRAAQQQDRTWQRVSDLEARHGGGDTHFLGDALRSADERAARLVAGLAPLPFQSGVLLCIAGQPVQLEVFDSPRTLASVWSALLHAAAVDALSCTPVATPGRRARRFLDRVRSLSQTSHDGTHGSTSRRASPYAELTSLSWGDRTVHAVATNPRHELVMA